jgi:hypothetical protein
LIWFAFLPNVQPLFLDSSFDPRPKELTLCAKATKEEYWIFSFFFYFLFWSRDWSQLFVALQLFLCISGCLVLATTKKRQLPLNMEKMITSVLNWCHMRNTDQKSSLQHLTAQKTRSPSFSAKVHITITKFKWNSIQIRQTNSKATTYLFFRGIFKRTITGKNLQRWNFKDWMPQVRSNRFTFRYYY